MPKHRKYAEGTKVEVHKSMLEIERILTTRIDGVTGIATGSDFTTGQDIVRFSLNGIVVRLAVPYTKNIRERKRLWRVLVLFVKSSVENARNMGISPNIVFTPFYELPDGQIAGQVLHARFQDALQAGQLPELMPRRD